MERAQPYADRLEAGRALAGELGRYADRDDVVVLGLPRGGVPVAGVVADALRAPLDVLVVRKLGAPGQPELAMGAITAVEDRVEIVRHEPVLKRLGVRPEQFVQVLATETAELRRREHLYRGSRPTPDVTGKVVIVVDDGLATGSTMRAALTALRRRDPAWLVVAVPVGSSRTCDALRTEADEVVCPWTPEPFYGVGQGYRDFSATSDAEVRQLVTTKVSGTGGTQGDGDTERSGGLPPAGAERAVRIDVGGAELDADVAVPAGGARGVVVFAHGSGSSRRSPRNRQVATALRRAGFATVLMDLLTADEDRVDRRTRELRFDIALLAARLAAAVDWWSARSDLPVVTFGASTGAAAALMTASERPAVVGVVSRGGRPDLAGEALGRVRVPTLLVVGGQDHQVLDLNRRAAETLAGPVEIAVVPGATHLFEEPGALDEVVRLTVAALDRWLPPPRRR